MSHSLLCSIGRRDWSAPDEEGYLDKAAKIAASPLLIGQVRTAQRDAMRRSPLLDSAGMARSLEDAFETMFDRWMERRRR
jgi:predicted O-linked N-acetylglucosamine transferase (SPINDLY family)